MNTITQPPAIDIESLVAEAADRFTDEIKQGRAPSIEEYAAQYPDIAAIIRQVFPALAVLDSPGATAGLSSSAHAEGVTVGLLGDFRILREVGRGGMGVVYEAEQISLGRRVALKVLPFAAMLDRQQLARFKNEARAAATLDHPNIVAIYSVGAERGVHYYAMQLIEGQSLAQVIEHLRRDRLPLPPGRRSAVAGEGRGEGALESATRNPKSEIDTVPTAALSTLHVEDSPGRAPSSSLPAFASREYFRTIAHLGIQAAEALDHAHQNGILHRDIKPANLLVECSHLAPRDDGSHLKLWITDFGLARMEQDTGITMTGDLLGTLRYMSPEQALAKRVVVDHRSDIYSLGVTLYELLTLQPAYTATDRQELLRQIAFEEPRKPRQINARIPQDLETIILKAIEKNPVDRYAAANELTDDLRRFVDDRAIKAKPPSLLNRANKLWHRHRKAAIAGMGVLGVGLLALSFAIASRWHRISEATRFAESSLAAAQTALEANNTQLALQKLAQAQTRIDAAYISGGRIAREVAIWQFETVRYAKFESLLRKARLTRSGKSADFKTIQAAIQSYNVVHDPNWLESLHASCMPEAQRVTVIEGAYELLILNAEHLVFWCLEWTDPTLQAQRNHRCREAMTYLDKAISFHAPSRGYYWVLANCAIIMDDPAKAAWLRKLALETPPHNAAELFYVNRDRRARPVSPARGDPAYSFEENYAGHREMLRKDPTYYNGLFFMAYILGLEGRHAEALPAWYGCVALRPDDITALNYRASTHLKLGHYEEALADVEHALAIAPESWVAHQGASWFLATCPDAKYRNGQRAVELAKKGYQMDRYKQDAILDPAATANMLDALAVAYAEVGDFDQAIKSSEQALKHGAGEVQRSEFEQHLQSFRQHRPWREGPKPENSKP